MPAISIVTELSERIARKAQRRSVWQRLRRLFSALESIDVDEIGGIIAKFQANQRKIQEPQPAVGEFLRRHTVAPTAPALISPVEFGTGHRFELQNRWRVLTQPGYP